MLLLLLVGVYLFLLTVYLIFVTDLMEKEENKIPHSPNITRTTISYHLGRIYLSFSQVFLYFIETIS